MAYHDACHLAHAQGVRDQPRDLLRAIPGLELVEPDGWEICCGSAGIYNLVKPERGRRAGPAQGREPAGHGRGGRGGRQPGLRPADRRTHTRLGRELEVMHPVELLRDSIARP